MQKLEMSLELTDGELKRLTAKGKALGLDIKATVLLAFVAGCQQLGVDVSGTDPLELIADDLGDEVG